jgi:hypothetical protein
VIILFGTPCSFGQKFHNGFEKKPNLSSAFVWELVLNKHISNYCRSEPSTLMFRIKGSQKFKIEFGLASGNKDIYRLPKVECLSSFNPITSSFSDLLCNENYSSLLLLWSLLAY